MEYENGLFSDNSFNVFESQNNTIFISDSGALIVNVSGIGAQFYSDYYQYNHKIFVANGTFSIEFKNISVSYKIDMKSNDVLEKTMPIFEVSEL